MFRNGFGSLVIALIISTAACEELAYVSLEQENRALDYANLSEYNGLQEITMGLASSSDRESTPLKTKTDLESLRKIFGNRIDDDSPFILDEATYWAQKNPGEHSIDQVCAVYDFVRESWNYTSDKRGTDYFRYSNQTLSLGKRAGLAGAGDCDDFAILMASLIEGLGGTTRIIVAYGPGEGHAYAEVYLGNLSSTEEKDRIERMIQWLKMKYTINEIYYHINLSSGDVWLNLDWFAYNPGGPFSRTVSHTPLEVRSVEKIPLNLPNERPTAVIIPDVSKPNVGQTVFFDASHSHDDGDIVDYRWEFGDGNTGPKEVFVGNTYKKSGRFLVNLTIKDNFRAEGRNTTEIVVNEPPTAVFSFLPPAPKLNETVVFNATQSKDLEAGPLIYKWTFGDGDSGIGVIKYHPYLQWGTYTVNLTVVDSNGAENSTSREIKVNKQPHAIIRYDKEEPNAGDLVSFSASDSSDDDGSIAGYFWEFGDGNTSEDKSPDHVYPNGGNFTVKLTVRDSDNATDANTTTIRINERPTVGFTFSPVDPEVNEEITFDASESKDPDGIIEYIWDFGEGKKPESWTVPEAYYAYHRKGTYQVKLMVKDSKGATDFQMQQVEIKDRSVAMAPAPDESIATDEDSVTQPPAPASREIRANKKPIAIIRYDKEEPNVGDLVSFSASDSSDDDGSIAGYFWEFGDGNTSEDKSPDHVYPSGGNFIVKLTVTDRDNATDANTTTIRINERPTVGFTFSPVDPEVNEEITFDASESKDPDGIIEYIWDFGEGKKPESWTVPEAYYAYHRKGTYQVKLMVKDSKGATDFQMQQVEIKDRSVAMAPVPDESISKTKGSAVPAPNPTASPIAEETKQFAVYSIEIRGTVAGIMNGTNNLLNNSFTWTSQNFPGFYYDINEDIGTEMLITELSEGNVLRGEAPYGIIYKTAAKAMDYEFEDWGSYNGIGFLGRKYFAGYIASEDASKGIFLDKSNDSNSLYKKHLEEILIDDNRERIITSGTPLKLEEGYELAIKAIDIDGNKVYLELTKDGSVVDSKVISPSKARPTMADKTYYYKKDVGDSKDLVIIAAHFKNAFRGADQNMVTIDGVWQISDTATEVKVDTEYDNMRIASVTADTITMDNKDNAVTLSKNEEVALMTGWSIKTADNDTLRYWIYKPITIEVAIASSQAEALAPDVSLIVERPYQFIAGSVEIRGETAGIVNGTGNLLNKSFTWDTRNFPGFYYDINEDIGSEVLTANLSNENELRGGEPYGVIYKTTTKAKNFEFEDWGRYNVIGFMGEKFFAGYIGSNNASKNIFFKESTDRNSLSRRQLERILIDDDSKRMLTSGTPLKLEEGYELAIRSIDIDGNKVYLELSKDGMIVDNKIVSPSINGATMFDKTYYYQNPSVGSQKRLVTIAVHFNNAFRGADQNLAKVDGVWQISDAPIEVETNAEYDKMSIRSIDAAKGIITMSNKDNEIILEKSMDISLMSGLRIRTADNDTLRYYIYKPATIGGAIEPSQAPAPTPHESITAEEAPIALTSAPNVDLIAESPQQFIEDNVEIRGETAGIVNGTGNLLNKSFTWDSQNFPGFYYDIDEDIDTEMLIINLSEGNELRGEEPYGVIYKTAAKAKDYEFDDWGRYNVIGFMGEKYFAGYIESNDASKNIFFKESIDRNSLSRKQLQKILVDDDIEMTVTSGTSLKLEEGYELAIKAIDIDGNKAYLELSKDGSVVDSKVISPSKDGATMADKTYYYKNPQVGDQKKLVTIGAHFKNAFRGADQNLATVDGLWQISDAPTEVKADTQYDKMTIRTVDATNGVITMDNKDNAITLSKNKDSVLMAGVKIKTADNDTLRYYIYKEITEPGDYQIRGKVATESDTWNSQNFAGFYHNVNDIGTEILIASITDGNKLSGYAPYGVTYKTSVLAEEYDFADWGSYEVIGFMGKKHFAGYIGSNNASRNIFFKESTDRNSLSRHQIERILIDDDSKRILTSGTPLKLEEGYELAIKSIDIDGNKVYLELSKDGMVVDQEIVSPSVDGATMSDQTYYYKNPSVGNQNHLVTIAVHFKNAFRGADQNLAKVDGVWQISDAPIMVETNIQYGKMSIMSVDAAKGVITMNNKDNEIILKKNRDISLMPGIMIKTADNNTLRYCIYKPMTIEEAIASPQAAAPAPDVGLIVERPYQFIAGSVEIRGEEAGIVNGTSNIVKNSFTWDTRNFPGFYYDINEDIGTEVLTANLSNENELSGGEPYGVIYKTTAKAKNFEFEDWGRYKVIGFEAEKYFAGYISSEDASKNIFFKESIDGNSLYRRHIEKILIDEDRERKITSDTPLKLEAGYELTIKSIDIDSNKVRLELSKDGSVVDSKVISPSMDAATMADKTYYYMKDVGASKGLVIIAAHIRNAFRNADENLATIDGVWQISDTATEVKVDTVYDKMRIASVSTETITMDNRDNPVTLSKNKYITLMSGMKIKTADNDTVRYCICKEITRPGDYRILGSAADGNFAWNSQNFAGFYYNANDDTGTETLITSITEGNMLSGDAPYGVTYKTSVQAEEYDFADWGSYKVIGFLGEKYFAGYVKSNNASKNIFFKESTDCDSLSSEQLEKILVDDDTEMTVTSGTPLKLEEGYELTIKSIDIDGNKVYLELSKDGMVVDKEIISPSIDGATMFDKTYYYQNPSVGSQKHLVTIGVHFKNAFRGSEQDLATVNGVWQISDAPIEVETNTEYDKMSIRSVDAAKGVITMNNKDNDIILEKNMDISLALGIGIRTADNDTLRYHIYKQATIEGAFEPPTASVHHLQMKA